MESVVLYRRESKRSCSARELLFVNKQNRIVIRDNNSLELLDRIFSTASFAFEWSIIGKFFDEQLSQFERLVEGYLAKD